MRKRKTIYALLDRLSTCKTDPPHEVVIKGEVTGLTLYKGSFYDVPFARCSDFVKSYVRAGSKLEIVSTSSPFIDDDPKGGAPVGCLSNRKE